MYKLLSPKSCELKRKKRITKFEVLLVWCTPYVVLVLFFLMTLMIMIFLLAMMMIVILLMMMTRISEEANKHKGAASGRAANQGDNEDGHHT